MAFTHHSQPHTSPWLTFNVARTSGWERPRPLRRWTINCFMPFQKISLLWSKLWETHTFTLCDVLDKEKMILRTTGWKYNHCLTSRSRKHPSVPWAHTVLVVLDGTSRGQTWRKMKKHSILTPKMLQTCWRAKPTPDTRGSHDAYARFTSRMFLGYKLDR